MIHVKNRASARVLGGWCHPFWRFGRQVQRDERQSKARSPMQRRTIDLLIALGAAIFVAQAGVSSAAVCANGVYRAGCAGPNGAAVVHKPPVHATTCVNGVYRAGCAGPNGAVVAHKPYVAPRVVAGGAAVPCRYINGVRVCR